MRQRLRYSLAAIAVLSLFLSCSIEEDLRIHSDGSGTYRVKVSIPKELGDFGDLRKDADKEGFTIEQQGETESERFIVLRKNFTDITALNDSHQSFELTTADSGFLRREYRLRITLHSPGFVSYKRSLVITMPGRVASTTEGEIDGSRVKWEGSGSARIEIVASGFFLPFSGPQKLLFVLALAGGLAALVVHRRRQTSVPALICPGCNQPLPAGARFCRACGALAPVAES